METRKQIKVLTLWSAILFLTLLFPWVELVIAQPAPRKVRVGAMMLTGEAGVYVALEKGFFREEGVEAPVVVFGRSTEAIQAQTTGDLDVSYQGVSAGIFNLINRGFDLKLVAGGAVSGKYGKKSSASAIVVRKDLWESGQFRDYKDMKGKKIAVVEVPGPSGIAVDVALKQGGLTLKDVEWVNMPFPTMLVAMTTKAIDLAWVVEPFLTQGLDRGLYTKWKELAELRPGHDSTIWIYSPTFVKNDPEAARRFMVGLIRGNREYFNAFFGDGKNRSEVISILIKHTRIKEPALYAKMDLAGVNPNGYIGVPSLTDDLDWFVKNGFVDRKPDMNKMIDHQYVDYALTRLGKASVKE